VILEALAWLATPCAWPARRLGLLSEQIAIAARQRRLGAAWAGHRAQSRQAVIDAAAAGGRTALVLGSGLLLDVPLAELKARFARVILVDAVQPWRARLVRGVELRAVDVTQSMARLMQGDAAVTEPTLFLDQPGLDFTVSLNLISQLPILPRAWIERHRLGDADAHARALIRAHRDWLLRLPGRVCVVGDLRYRLTDAKGAPVAETDALEGVAMPPADREWDWPVAPLGEHGGGRERSHRVGAWLDFKAAAARLPI